MAERLRQVAQVFDPECAAKLVTTTLAVIAFTKDIEELIFAEYSSQYILSLDIRSVQHRNLDGFANGLRMPNHNNTP